ncbi:NCS2 family permease [Romeria aff. gracilis LEGE 07310]|uniref:NCS2 family permease n=1 Tax=Vasconcelosia minhoensis LEGE 07310 TaxID=915328 RepID=A0A8J7AWE1_9CYAN|nr:NCS2 family permease [Romeria gracilis]MBE9078393.1 NCS2 family permease [Romeria aff. gracilis LEGE 07310]
MNQSQVDDPHTRPSGPPPPQYEGWQAKVADYFNFSDYRTNFRAEIVAGLTTFMTMAYILVVHPLILSDAVFVNESGDLFQELVVVTGISAAIGSLIMGLYAKYPFVQAPGMGTNAFFAYSVVLGLGISWQTALAAVFIEGLIFIALTVTDVRRHLITAVPGAIKAATTVGIGLFLAYIGLSGNTETGGAGLIVASDATKTAFGSFAEPATLLAAFGILLSSFFIVRRIKGALLWGIAGTAILGWVLGVTAAPTEIAKIPPFPSTLFGAAFSGLAGINAGNLIDFLAVLLVFLFVDLFDTIGTLTGVGTQAGYIDENGELPRANQALSADAIATTTGAILGTSTVTTFAESAAGIAEGGRTGLTAVVAAVMFIIALLFVPIFSAVPAYATAPALLIVGVLMMSSVTGIRWADLTESIPAFATIFFIPLGFSIAEGLALGLILYPFTKLVSGRAKEVPVVTWILAVLFIARFIFTTLRFG